MSSASQSVWGLEDISLGEWCGGEGLLMAATAMLLAYVSYYLGWVARRPQVVGTGELRERLVKNCPILSEYYWPTFWAFYCHLSTIVRVLLQKRPNIKYQREILTLSDGGEIALDWGMLKTDSCIHRNKDVATPPVLLILAGITGCSTDNYVQHLVEDGLLEGYITVVFNQRGNGGIKLKTLRTYSGSDISDLFEVVQYIQKTHPTAPVIGVGVSLGGMILTQYLHQLGKQCDLSAVIAVSMSWQPFMTRKSLEEGPLINKWVYSRLMVTNIQGMVKSNMSELTPEQREALPLDLKRIMTAKVVSEIDTHLTAPLFGFSCVEDYYRACQNDDKMHKIRKPFVCITSADDPFVPKESLPFLEFERNSDTVLVVTSHGGHFGFIEGLYPNQKTWMDRAIRQILATFKQQC